MNTFKRKALTCAVLAGLGGVATTAEAVYRNPDGTGMVLVYPYYTVNAVNGSNFNTYISVTNTTSQAKVTKVRFREGRTSAEVLDFNLYLSPNDVWVGAVGPFGGSTSADAPAAIFRNPTETSCTYPTIPPNGEPFKNVDYSGAGTLASLPGTGLDRTREGYVEIFDMATLTGTAATNITHTAIGAPPPNCTAMQIDLTTNATLFALLTSPTGGLYGEGTLINVSNAAVVGYKADALDAYRSGQYYADVSSANPVLGGSAAPFSLVLANNRATTDQWATGRNAVAAVFMHTSVMNDYILESGSRANTDWVVTFPGKNEFYGIAPATAGTPVAPYTGVLTTQGACEPARFTFFDRNEMFGNPPAGGFSPQTGTAGPNIGDLCWESTVVSIRNAQGHTSAADVSSTNRRSNVLGSRNVLAVTQTDPSFEAGWLNMVFTGANALVGIGSVAGGDLTASNVAGFNAFGPVGVAQGTFTARLVAPGHTFTGLPVTGFMVTARANGAVACTTTAGTAGSCSGNYMTLFNHSYRTTITP